LPQYHGKTEKNPGWITIQIDDPIIAKKKTSITLQRPLFERYFFEEDRTLNTDKTIVIIQNDEGKEIYDAYINSFTTAKRNCHSGKLFSSW
jgi:hypothetical protein